MTDVRIFCDLDFDYAQNVTKYKNLDLNKTMIAFLIFFDGNI